MLPATSNSDHPLPVPSGRIQRWIRDVKSVKQSKSDGRATSDAAKSSNKTKDVCREGGKGERGDSSEIRYDAYMSLVDHTIRNAYV